MNCPLAAIVFRFHKLRAWSPSWYSKPLPGCLWTGKEKKIHAGHKQVTDQHERQQADRKRCRPKKPCGGVGQGYRQLMAWECKMSKTKACLVWLPLFTSGNTDDQDMVQEQGKHCCSANLRELVAEALSEPKCWVFLTTNIFWGITAILRNNGENNCS